MGEIKGLIWNIQRFNVHDGEGIRTIVFFKGCPLRCLWCANPEGQLMEKEIKVVPGKDSDENEILGKWLTVKEVMQEVIKDKVFYHRSNGGLTLSGGEVLMQADFAMELLKKAKDAYIDTAIETCGYAPWKDYQKVLPYTDLFLFDIKHMDSKQHKDLTGGGNELILENAKKLSEQGAKIIFRVPIIPGLNDSSENIKKIAEFASEINVKGIELLAYHQLGVNKYQMLGKTYELNEITPPAKEEMESLKSLMVPIFSKVKIH